LYVIACVVFRLELIGTQLYRAFVIWDRRPALIAIPALSWLAFVGIGITVNLSCASVAAKINFTPVYLAYFVLSVTTNTLCTILICTRIIMHRREIRGVGIAADVEYSYLTNTMAESGAWYAIAGLVNIAYYVKSSDFAQITETVFGCLAFLTQAHVILRRRLQVRHGRQQLAAAQGEHRDGVQQLRPQHERDGPHGHHRRPGRERGLGDVRQPGEGCGARQHRQPQHSERKPVVEYNYKGFMLLFRCPYPVVVVVLCFALLLLLSLLK
jgi:hypothetical protein